MKLSAVVTTLGGCIKAAELTKGTCRQSKNAANLVPIGGLCIFFAASINASFVSIDSKSQMNHL